MQMKEEFNKLIEKLKVERDEVSLKIHLASMDAKKEYEEAEKKWVEVKAKASQITDGAVETSEEFIAKVKVVGEELKGTYSRISSRLSK